ncbi:glycoside hydrolase family 130 protein [Catenulispora yoronensis]|uniref:Glycoside hydrolase family 130 protein n=1 Tax=Catenulispora yoronensis TaxID=450799 RepID=A0ABP5H6S3_9ACTN
MTVSEAVPPVVRAAVGGIAVDELLVTRRRLRLNRDPSRVVARLFVPGAHPPEMSSRAAAVVRRIMALTDDEVELAYERLVAGFGGRHRDLERTFADNFRVVAHRVPGEAKLSGLRELLIGAHFTHEYAIEGAAFTNPSMVAHPDQSGLEPGQLRFLMSARAIGEGHLSCVEFRTGIVGPNGELTVDPPSPYAGTGHLHTATYSRTQLAHALNRPYEDDEILAFLLHHLPENFTEAELEGLLGALSPELLVLERTFQTLSRVHWFIACQYRVQFPEDRDVSENVLWPTSPTERHGIEDARFVRFTDDDGRSTYRATYTAYDGSETRTQVLETDDFRTFRMSQLFGKAVGNKGLALFPRKINGQYAALSRWDRESNSLATSQDGRVWPEARDLEVPFHNWDLMQVGNCGSPVETEEGWLVLTHGVGAMRVYALGALLLDLDDPSRVLAALKEPLLIASPDERDGYVPNVVYSCGPLKHQDTLVIPYGFGDMGVEFATVPVPALLERMRTDGAVS